MEFKALPTVTVLLVLVGMIVGVGVLTFDKFGDAAKLSTTVAFKGENVTTAGGAATLANDEVTSFTALGNSSGNFSTNLSGAEAGTITTVYPTVANGSYWVGYVYDADTSATTALGASSTAVGGIANSWMALIVTIVVLALILAFVVNSFGRK